MYFYFYSSTFFEKILLLYLSTFFRDTFKNTRVFSKVFFLPCFEGSKGSKPRFPRSQRFKDSKGTKGFQGSQDLLKKYSRNTQKVPKKYLKKYSKSTRVFLKILLLLPEYILSKSTFTCTRVLFFGKYFYFTRVLFLEIL